MEHLVSAFRCRRWKDEWERVPAWPLGPSQPVGELISQDSPRVHIPSYLFFALLTLQHCDPPPLPTWTLGLFLSSFSASHFHGCPFNSIVKELSRVKKFYFAIYYNGNYSWSEIEHTGQFEEYFWTLCAATTSNFYLNICTLWDSSTKYLWSFYHGPGTFLALGIEQPTKQSLCPHRLTF